MARVYADVNQQMPRSYWDYDSVNITWGVLENYEVVRKIGMPSQLSVPPLQRLISTPRYRAREILGGLRRHQRCQLPEVCHQSAETGQEEEDQAGDQDPAEPFWGPEHRRSARRRQRQPSKSILS